MANFPQSILVIGSDINFEPIMKVYNLDPQHCTLNYFLVSDTSVKV